MKHPAGAGGGLEEPAFGFGHSYLGSTAGQNLLSGAQPSTRPVRFPRVSMTFKWTAVTGSLKKKTKTKKLLARK